MIALLVICGLLASLQSLGDLARREAERRREVDARSPAAKEVLQSDFEGSRATGNLSTFSPPRAESPPGPDPRDRGRDSPERFRAALRKLDREIRTAEDRITLLRAREEAERREALFGRASRSRGRSTGGNGRADVQIAEVELRLKRLRQDRRETYDAGRRAGFLPGDLDGKGIVP